MTLSCSTPEMITKRADRSVGLGKPTQDLGQAALNPVETGVVLIETGPGLRPEFVEEFVERIAVVLKSRNAARDAGFARHVGHSMWAPGETASGRKGSVDNDHRPFPGQNNRSVGSSSPRSAL